MDDHYAKVDVTDAAYIPRATGEGLVRNVASELAQTKLRHKEIVGKLEAAHRELLSATTKHYEKYVDEIRLKAKNTRARYKELLGAAHNDIMVQKEEIASLRDDKGALILQKAKLVAGGAAMHQLSSAHSYKFTFASMLTTAEAKTDSDPFKNTFS